MRLLIYQRFFGPFVFFFFAFLKILRSRKNARKIVAERKLTPKNFINLPFLRRFFSYFFQTNQKSIYFFKKKHGLHLFENCQSY